VTATKQTFGACSTASDALERAEQQQRRAATAIHFIYYEGLAAFKADVARKHIQT
jgi:hypothetical protein